MSKMSYTHIGPRIQDSGKTTGEALQLSQLTAWREFPSHSTGRGTQTKTSKPAELGNRSEFKEAEAARIGSIECRRWQRCSVGAPETHSRHDEKADQWLPMTEGVQRELAVKKRQETFRGDRNFYTLIVVVVVTQLKTLVKTH